MGSNILPQALLSIPRTASPFSSNLGFPILPSSFNSNRIIIPRLSLNGFGSLIAPVIVRPNKRSVPLNAELNSEGETVEIAEFAESEDFEDEDVEGKGSELAISETEEKPPPRKPRIKLGDIMGILNKRAVEASEKERPIPDIRTGDIVEIKLEVPENRRRASIYKGIVMSRQNAGIHTTIRIRRIIAGIGVEIVFPLYSPNIKEIKVVKHRKVRRARLYYLRDKLPRLSTFK
ncbi:large ribosomal subunit protein bL19cz-like [Tasmannia lanceolata]|uniref:large ribosomal subunit protein bL19cz-like n=1 Tax=Tasmannia lanceolata TaxID=3420 RepID=UPI0040649531